MLVRLQPYQQSTVVHRKSQKPSPRYYGPFLVEERIGPVAYRLNLPATSRIHPVFHISTLKPFRGEALVETCPLPPSFGEENHQPEPVVICAARIVLSYGRPQQQVLVQWQDTALEDAT